MSDRYNGLSLIDAKWALEKHDLAMRELRPLLEQLTAAEIRELVTLLRGEGNTEWLQERAALAQRRFTLDHDDPAALAAWTSNYRGARGRIVTGSL
jgi:hypothetical protein